MRKGFILTSLLAGFLVLFAGRVGATSTPLTVSGPVNDTVCNGSNAFFVFNVTDTSASPGTIGYAWFRSADGGTTWSAVSSSAPYRLSNDTLYLTASGALNNNMFYCVASDSAGSDTSMSAVLTVENTAVALPISGPTEACVGRTILLTNPNVMGRGVWSAKNGNASISATGLVTGVSGGLDTFTYVFTNACNSVTSTSPSVEIDAAPSTGSISGASGVCAGSWIHLTESIGGGVWLSSSSALAVVDASGNVTGMSAGTAIISYVVSNACGDFAATHAVTVNSTSTSLIGIDSVGVDSTRMLSDIATGGAWSIADTTIATINSAGVVTGVNVGVTVVTYTVTNACGTYNVTEPMYVGLPPYVSPITGPDSVCLSHVITLTDTITGGVWSSGDTTKARVNALTGDVSGISYGYVNLTYTYTNGFGSNYVVSPIFVNQPPVVLVSGPAVVALSGDYFFFGYPSGGTWTTGIDTMGSIISTGYLSDTAIDSAHNLNMITYTSFVVLKPGTVDLIYTVGNTCGVRTGNFSITLPKNPSSVPVLNGADAGLQVYPNPTTGSFAAYMTTAEDEPVTLSVTNVLGEEVMVVHMTSNHAQTLNLDQPAGLYMLNASAAGGTKYSTRIMLNR